MPPPKNGVIEPLATPAWVLVVVVTAVAGRLPMSISALPFSPTFSVARPVKVCVLF